MLSLATVAFFTSGGIRGPVASRGLQINTPQAPSGFVNISPPETTGALFQFDFSLFGHLIASNGRENIALPTSVGGGASLADLNGDGFPDLVQARLVVDPLAVPRPAELS